MNSMTEGIHHPNVVCRDAIRPVRSADAMSTYIVKVKKRREFVGGGRWFP